MSQGVTVSGVMSGGFLSGLARAFLTNESFFTTQVEYPVGGGERLGEVLLAPSDPGGVLLHTLEGRREDDILLTGGAYVASDNGVQVTTELQSRFGNSVLSGTGFFLLRASGRGCLACAAYGSVHKYILRAGETRAVDNGHLVAWTASMSYTVGLGGRRGGFISSVSSGEGLMCFFQGPGVIFVQSHKPNVNPDGTTSNRRTSSGLGLAPCLMVCLPIFGFIFFVIVFIVMQSLKSDASDDIYESIHYGGRQNRPYGEM